MNEREFPLKGRHVLITRGGEQGEQMCMAIASFGGIPHMVPLIDFRPYNDPNAHIYIQHLEEYDWIIFTSKNGVNFFFQSLIGKVERHLLHHIQFAVVGEKTMEALSRYHFPALFMPSIYTAEAFSQEFINRNLHAKKVLVVKGNLAKQTIANQFRNHGIAVDEWIVYETFYPKTAANKLISDLQADMLDIAAFTSPSTFNHFQQIAKQHFLTEHTKKLRYAAIGTVTKQAIESGGYRVDICPATFTIDAMLAEICQYYRSLIGKE